MPKSISWRKITKRHKVVDKGDHYETGSNLLITWSSKDSHRAQYFLRNVSKLKKRRKK